MISTIYKSKAELRVETEKQVKLFLKKGGSIEVVKARKAPKQKMRAKNSGGFSNGTSGFANSFPSKSTFHIG